eukprot:TRINITY_DN1035_c0_g2_i1.p1 TRINITY_DN1035_c0_g2~~TRINITY_DN1035_c0_g2_i1.p1  ORF type:complete len:468 (+),score=103.92 TRINITY_DN1035_c0_g2_i1:754-2157(+)
MDAVRVALPALCMLLLIHLAYAADTSNNSLTCPTWLPLPQANTNSQHNNAPSPRIVGGALAHAHITAHMVSFYNEGCAGSLLSPRWALTAAHCLVRPSSLAFVAGQTSNSGTVVEIEAVFSHPDFFLPKHDISVVKFVTDVPADARFVRLNVNHNIPHVHEFSRVAGYGYTTEGFDASHDARLRQVDVPVVATHTCKQAYGTVDSFLSSGINQSMHICAGYQRGGCDSCNADSGGPLFVYDAQLNVIQIALVSFGYGCARAAVPGGYTRVSSYIQWLRSVGAQFHTATSRNAVMMGAAGASSSQSASSTMGAAASPSASSTGAGAGAGAQQIETAAASATSSSAPPPPPSSAPSPSSANSPQASQAPQTVVSQPMVAHDAPQPTLFDADADADHDHDDDELGEEGSQALAPSADAQKVGASGGDDLFVELEKRGAGAGVIAGGTVAAVGVVALVALVVLVAPGWETS